MHQIYQLLIGSIMPTLNIFARDSAISYGMKLNIDNATGRPHTPFLALGVVRGVGGWNMHSQSFIFRNDPPTPYIFFQQNLPRSLMQNTPRLGVPVFFVPPI